MSNDGNDDSRKRTNRPHAVTGSAGFGEFMPGTYLFEARAGAPIKDAITEACDRLDILSSGIFTFIKGLEDGMESLNAQRAGYQLYFVAQTIEALITAVAEGLEAAERAESATKPDAKTDQAKAA